MQNSTFSKPSKKSHLGQRPNLIQNRSPRKFPPPNKKSPLLERCKITSQEKILNSLSDFNPLLIPNIYVYSIIYIMYIYNVWSVHHKVVLNSFLEAISCLHGSMGGCSSRFLFFLDICENKSHGMGPVEKQCAVVT